MRVERRSALPGGFSLLEVVLALGIFSIGLLGVLFMSVTALKSTHISKTRVTAVNLAQSRLDQLRSDRTLPRLETTLDAYGQPGAGIFTRTSDLASDTAHNYTVITVTVSWADGGTRQVVLKTIQAD